MKTARTPSITHALPALLLLVWLGLLVGCSRTQLSSVAGTETGASQDTTAALPPTPRPYKPLNSRAYTAYLLGVKYEEFGDLYNAAVSYGKALKYFPTSNEIRIAYARTLLGMQNSDQALAILSEITLPTAETYAMTADAYRMKGDNEQAHRNYLKAVALDSNMVSAYSYLAGYYREQNDIDSTLWAYQQLLRLRPSNSRLRNEIARLNLMRGEEGQAVQELRQSFDADPSNGNISAALMLAEIYQQTGKLDSALLVLKQAHEVDSTNSNVNNNLMQLYIRLDSVSQALPPAHLLARSQPDNPTVARRYGAILLSVDSVKAADSIFTELAHSADSILMDHYYLGRIAVISDDFPRALDEFRIVAQQLDTLAQSWIDLGFVYRQLGDTAGEIKAYTEGLNHVRGRDQWLTLEFALGAAYERTNRVKEAIDAFEAILKTDPQHTETLNYLGYLLADRGLRLDYAQGLIAKALKIAPDNAAYLDSYGWVFYRQRKYDQALKYLRRAAERRADPVIYEHLGDTYQALGKPDEAREWWRKALSLQPDNDTLKEKLNK